MALVVDERKVRVKMAEAGFRSLNDLVKASGITYRTFGKLFDGGDFTSATVERLAETLNCKGSELLSDVANRPHPEAPALAAV